MKDIARNMIIGLVGASMILGSVAPAYAITASQRVQIQKYYSCLAYQRIMPWIVCIPYYPTSPTKPDTTTTPTNPAPLPN